MVTSGFAAFTGLLKKTLDQDMKKSKKCQTKRFVTCLLLKGEFFIAILFKVFSSVR